MCDIPMNPCEPMPGNGINISINIDLGSFLNPCSPMDMTYKPSASIVDMPVDPKPPVDEDKIIRFLDKKESKGFDEAKKNALSKFGGKDVEKDQKEEECEEKEECEEE